MNAGYNGSKGSNLDVTIAPRATESSPLTNPGNVLFNYEQATAFSRFNAGTLRVNKRLSSGIAVGANYQYSHSIDDAGSVGGTSSVVAQNWQDILAEEGNSSFDVRHKVSGNYLYELPFGKDKFWFTTGKSSHILEGFSISGTFTFATGSALTPSYQATINDVARGTAGTERPDRVPGVSLTAGGGSLKHWFNTAAFTAPDRRQIRQCFWQRLAQLHSRPGHDPEQHVALENHATWRNAQLRDARHRQQRLQHGAILRRRYDALYWLGSHPHQSLRPGNIGGCHAFVSVQCPIQVLMT